MRDLDSEDESASSSSSSSSSEGFGKLSVHVEGPSTCQASSLASSNRDMSGFTSESSSSSSSDDSSDDDDLFLINRVKYGERVAKKKAEERDIGSKLSKKKKERKAVDEDPIDLSTRVYASDSDGTASDLCSEVGRRKSQWQPFEVVVPPARAKILSPDRRERVRRRTYVDPDSQTPKKGGHDDDATGRRRSSKNKEEGDSVSEIDTMSSLSLEERLASKTIRKQSKGEKHPLEYRARPTTLVVKKNNSVYERTKKWQAANQERIDALTKQKQIQKISNCTFSPNRITASKTPQTIERIVRGPPSKQVNRKSVSEHVKRQEAAREKRAKKPRPQGSNWKPTTTDFAPFNLSCYKSDKSILPTDSAMRKRTRLWTGTQMEPGDTFWAPTPSSPVHNVAGNKGDPSFRYPSPPARMPLNASIVNTSPSRSRSSGNRPKSAAATLSTSRNKVLRSAQPSAISPRFASPGRFNDSPNYRPAKVRGAPGVDYTTSAARESSRAKSRTASLSPRGRSMTPSTPTNRFAPPDSPRAASHSPLRKRMPLSKEETLNQVKTDRDGLNENLSIVHDRLKNLSEISELTSTIEKLSNSSFVPPSSPLTSQLLNTLSATNPDEQNYDDQNFEAYIPESLRGWPMSPLQVGKN